MTEESLEDQTVTLESMAVNPFNRWSDWYGTDGEAVVTIQTIDYILYQAWSRHCVDIEGGEWIETEDGGLTHQGETERNVRHDRFDGSKVRGPGIYLDDTHYDDPEKVDESYTIILPYDFMTPAMCRKWIEKLNQKYDRDFQLEITEEQEQLGSSTGLEDTGANRVKVETEGEYQ